MKGISQEEWKQSYGNKNETDGWGFILGALGVGTAPEGGTGGLRLTGECLEG